eukprot:827772-Pyramimonas_sp.AAC.1
MIEIVAEKDNIESEAIRTGKKVHFFSMLELSSVKHEELPPELGKFKGRVVVQGNTGKDETGSAAIFADAAFSASHIEASKLCDATALLPNYGGDQSDAPGACTQALLYGDGRIDPVGIWITLPKWRHPASWSKYRNPVRRLRLALCGHPLAVYVDDFKLAEPATNLHAGWDLIRKSGIGLDPPTPYSQYLGCGQQARDVPQNVFDKRMSTIRPMLPTH